MALYSLDLHFSKSILEKLLYQSALKTELQDIVKNLYSLDKILAELSKDGLINSEIKLYGKNITEISLTEKGRAVAEKLKEIDNITEGKAMVCPLCRYENPENAMYCMKCGNKLE